MRYQKLGKTGFEVSAISYGGVVSSQHFDKAVIPGDGQGMSDHFVSWAIGHGVNYFDVAPGYGDAQLLMGNSLRPYRKDVFLACKTALRDRVGAERDMMESLRLLYTDWFDVYQLHGLVTMAELETVFAPGGAMELLRDMREKGIARKIGITVHNEAVALKALDLYDFDTVLFPFNWHMHMAHGMGETLRNVARQKGAGLLCMKSMIERAWGEDERYASKYPKSWCKPIDIDEEPELLLAAVKYALSLGVDTLIPPGNFEHFRFAVEHIEEALDNPLSESERDLLSARLPKVWHLPFFDQYAPKAELL